MASLLLLLSLPVAMSQFNELIPITWSSVVFTMYGERNPEILEGASNLSPLGALQLHDAGFEIRNRYISSNSTYPIQGLSEDVIENDQIQVSSTDDEYISSGAMAFMQGLYPPLPGVNGAQDVLGNGSNVNFPLGGYQYPNIGTTSVFDYNYIYLAGNVECLEYNLALTQTNTNAVLFHTNSTLSYNSYYISLSSTIFSGLDASFLSYAYAYDLYEYALYQYNHNSTITALHNINSTLSTLYSLASQQTLSVNTPSDSVNASGIQTIAGSTLASKILSQFSSTITTSGLNNKLTLLFGSYEPFLAFFYLSSLTSSPFTTSQFSTLPLHGSMMAFELFSYVSASTDSSTSPYASSTFPSASELFVRFSFRNGTSQNSLSPENPNMSTYPLFDNGPSDAILSFAEFVDAVSEFSLLSLEEWCQSCDSDALFCIAVSINSSNSTSSCAASSTIGKKELSPAIGGVIGATITMIVILLVVCLLGILGFKVEYTGHRGIAGMTGKWGKGHNTLPPIGVVAGAGGGFKGPEKLPEDPDLVVGKTRHERVGSWELSDGKGRIGSLDKDLETGVVVGGAGWRGGKEEDEERIVSTADYGERRGSEDFLEGRKGVEAVHHV